MITELSMKRSLLLEACKQLNTCFTLMIDNPKVVKQIREAITYLKKGDTSKKKEMAAKALNSVSEKESILETISTLHYFLDKKYNIKCMSGRTHKGAPKTKQEQNR